MSGAPAAMEGADRAAHAAEGSMGGGAGRANESRESAGDRLKVRVLGEAEFMVSVMGF